MLAGLGLVLVLAVTAAFAATRYFLTLSGRKRPLAAAVFFPSLVGELAVIHKGALSLSVTVVVILAAVSLPVWPGALQAVRQLAVLTRRLCRQWCGVPIAGPYQPPPVGGRLGYRDRVRWLLGDPAGRRDLLWFAMNAPGGWTLAAASAGLIAYGLIGFILPGTGYVSAIPPPAFPGNIPEVLFVLGVGSVALGLWAGPWLARLRDAGKVAARAERAGGAGTAGDAPGGAVGRLMFQHLAGLLAFAVQLGVGQAESGDGPVAGAHQQQLGAPVPAVMAGTVPVACPPVRGQSA